MLIFFLKRGISQNPVLSIYWDFSGGQWLRLCIPNAGALGSFPDQGPRSYLLQLRPAQPNK